MYVTLADPPAQDSLVLLERVIGYCFRDRSLLQRALTHRSCEQEHNERLEFLGDSVLGCVLAEELFRRFGNTQEGLLTRFKAHLEQEHTLVQLAREMGIAEQLRVGGGQLGKAPSPGMLADALEAVLGAVMVDAGFAACRQVVLGWYAERLDALSSEEDPKDPKSLLQEYLQKRRLPLPQYTLGASPGDDAAAGEQFLAQCRTCLWEQATEGRGPTRRDAERQAAHAMLRHFLEGA